MYIARRLEGEFSTEINSDNMNNDNDVNSFSLPQRAVSLTWYERARRDQARYIDLDSDKDFFSPVFGRSNFVSLKSFGSAKSDVLAEDDLKMLSDVLKRQRFKKDVSVLPDVVVESTIIEKDMDDTSTLDIFRDIGAEFIYPLDCSDSVSLEDEPDFDNGFRFEDDIGVDVLVTTFGGNLLVTSQYSTTISIELKDYRCSFVGRANMVKRDDSICFSFFDLMRCGSLSVLGMDYCSRYEMLQEILLVGCYCSSNGMGNIRIAVMENIFDSRKRLDLDKFNIIISPRFVYKRRDNGKLLLLFVTRFFRVELVSVGGLLMIERSFPGRKRKLVIIGDYFFKSGYFYGYSDGDRLLILFERAVNYCGYWRRVNVSGFREIKKSRDAEFFSALVEKNVFKIEDKYRDLFVRESIRADRFAALYWVKRTSVNIIPWKSVNGGSNQKESRPKKKKEKKQKGEIVNAKEIRVTKKREKKLIWARKMDALQCEQMLKDEKERASSLE
jgi:hypothetical protein